MSKRKDNHYNNNVIIDNKVVSVSDLQTNAKSASMRFIVLVLGIVMLASMVVPYLSMAAAATSSSEAFNGTVIPGYSMGGLELTAYGVDLNSWGEVQKPTFVRSNYGIWNANNVPDNVSEVEQNFNEDNSENAIQSQSTTDRLLNTSDKSSGWERLTGRTNYTNNNPDGDTSISQNQKSDDVSPIRTITDYNYWNSKIPTSNSSNDANITVSLVPDFIVVSKNNNTNKAAMVISPDNTSNKAIMNFKDNNQEFTQAKPIYIPISKLMEKYSDVMGKGVHTFNDLFKAVGTNPDVFNDIVNDDNSDLLNGTIYRDLNAKTHSISNSEQAFNPYPYTMVFSTHDSVTNQTITSSIYENCEAYVYFSPTVVYQKYLQVKNEYNTIVNSASDNLNSDNPDAVTLLQVGYYAAALSILESYLEEALPQDCTRGYVGMSEPNNVRGDADGSGVGQLSSQFENKDLSSASSFQSVTYATLMYDVVANYNSEDAAKSAFNLDETNAIMDSLSVFGYSKEKVIKYTPGVMVGLPYESNFNRRTNLTPRVAEDSSLDSYKQKIQDLEDQYEEAMNNVGDDPQIDHSFQNRMVALQKQMDQATAEYKKALYGENANNAGIYTPVYYPIQQHKMPDNEKTYRFSILTVIPYDTVINYMNTSKLAKVELSYSSNFTSSFTSVTDMFENGTKQTALEQLVQQYNSGEENTGLDLSTFDASTSIACSPNNNTDTNTGTDQDKATEDTVQNRVDSALLGYSAGNMTSDNVHDLVDIMRALPAGKIETYFRFFNPIKADGDDQDFFVTRVTPAVTTYFPSLLVNGYENAGGAEVDQACRTSNVSFDYFSIPSFAPCFASHTASDTYYGALNYELRAFYKKGFIQTLSSKTNIPQIEAAQKAINDSDQAVSDLQNDNSISADTMAKNMVTIFVEAKRYIATLILQDAIKNYGKESYGMLNMDTVKTFYDEVYKYMFNQCFSEGYIGKIYGNITGNEIKIDEHDYDSKANALFNNWDWKKSIKSFDDLSNGTARSFIQSGTEQVSYDQGILNGGVASIVNGITGISDPRNEKYVNPQNNQGSTPQECINKIAKLTNKTVAESSRLWNDYIDNSTQVTDKDKFKVQLDGTSDANYAAITGIYWQASDGPEKGNLASGGNIFPSANTYLINLDGSGDNKSLGLRSGTSDFLWIQHDLKINAVAVISGNKAYGPVYYQKNSDLIISNDYLTKVNSMIISDKGTYYWGNYHDIEQSNAGTNESIDIGQLMDGEKSSIYVVGYSSGGGVYKKIAEEAASDDYATKVEEALNDACKEMFKDLINTSKNIQLIQQSMPSQMQNCLAWADYQNASDSEAQYQSDPTDTIDINLSQQQDTNAGDDYDKADVITGIPSLEAAGYSLNADGSVGVSKSVTGATNSAIQARMERGVEGSTWTSSVQPACYTITAIVARIDSMQNSGVSYPYNNICSGRLRSGADQYAILQAHVIDYSSIASGISGDLATRVHGKVVSITNPNYGALPDFLNILGTIGGIIAEATSGFAKLTGSMFEDVMWNTGNDSTTKVATSSNQADNGTIQTKKYDGTGNIERKGSMWVLSSKGGQGFYTLVQSLALVLVLISLLYIAFKNFYEYTKPSAASATIDDKDDAGKKSATAEKKILAATQLKVVMPRAIIAVFMIGLPPMSSGTGFQGGNFLLLQMLSSIFNQISYVFINLNGQSVMNLWLNTGADLLSNNPGIGDYIAYGAAMLVIGVMFVVGTLAVYLTDFILIFFYIIGPLMWALYVWPYNDITSKTEKKDGIISKLTSKMKFAWTGGRVGNKAPEGMIECYCQAAMLNVAWSIIFWAVTIIFTGVTGTIATTDSSSSTGNAATLANASSSTSSYITAALMSTGNYYASSSIAHADGLLNTGILPIPAWGRMLLATVLAVIVFMLMIKMAAGVFKNSAINSFQAVSDIAGAIKSGITGVGGRIAYTGGKLATSAAGKVASKVFKNPDTYDKVKHAAERAAQIGGTAGRTLSHAASHAAKLTRSAGTQAMNLATGKVSVNDALKNALDAGTRTINNAEAGKLSDSHDRQSKAKVLANAIKDRIAEGDVVGAQKLFTDADSSDKRALMQYSKELFEKDPNGADVLRSDIDENMIDKSIHELDDRMEFTDRQMKKHIAASESASKPMRMQKSAMLASGIGSYDEARNILLSEDVDDRTKRKMLGKVNDYMRKIQGSNATQFDPANINNHDEMLKAVHALDTAIPTVSEKIDVMKQRAGALEDAAYRFKEREAYANGNSSIPGNRELLTNSVKDDISIVQSTTLTDYEGIRAINQHMSDGAHKIIDEMSTKGLSEADQKIELEKYFSSLAGGSFMSTNDMLRTLGRINDGQNISNDKARKLAATLGNLQMKTDNNGIINLIQQETASVAAETQMLAISDPSLLSQEGQQAYNSLDDKQNVRTAAYSYSIPTTTYTRVMTPEMESIKSKNSNIDLLIKTGGTYNDFMREIKAGAYSSEEAAVIMNFVHQAMSQLHENPSFKSTIASAIVHSTGTADELSNQALAFLDPSNIKDDFDEINILKTEQDNQDAADAEEYKNALDKATQEAREATGEVSDAKAAKKTTKPGTSERRMANNRLAEAEAKETRLKGEQSRIAASAPKTAKRNHGGVI